MIAISNETNHQLEFLDSYNCIGNFNGSYEKGISAKNFNAFLHGKPKGQARGSYGAVSYKFELDDTVHYFAFGWANPYKMTNTGIRGPNSIHGTLSYRYPDLKEISEKAYSKGQDKVFVCQLETKIDKNEIVV